MSSKYNAHKRAQYRITGLHENACGRRDTRKIRAPMPRHAEISFSHEEAIYQRRNSDEKSCIRFYADCRAAEFYFLSMILPAIAGMQQIKAARFLPSSSHDFSLSGAPSSVTADYHISHIAISPPS